VLSEAPTATPPPLTFRRCLLLCLPALVFGFVLRAVLTYSVPEGYFGSDSNSYFDASFELWTNGKLEMGAKRRGLYPLFLIAAPALPGNTPQVVAIVQHAVGLAGLVAIGWITGHFVRRHVLWIPLVTILCAAMPQPLWFEREVIADSFVLNFFLLAVALALPISRLREQRGRLLFLIAAASLLALKPHGRPLWVGLVLAAVFIAGNPLRWGWRSHAALAASVFLILTTGSSRQGSWLFLSSTLPLVDVSPTNAKWQEYRQPLAPLLAEIGPDPLQYPWLQGDYKKRLNNEEHPNWAGTAWPALLKDEQKFAKVAKGLAIEGVLQHPFIFARMVLMKLGIAFSKLGEPNVKIMPGRFWDEQEVHNVGRWKRNPAQIAMIYERDQAGYQAMVAERVNRRVVLTTAPRRTANALIKHWLNHFQHLRWVKETHHDGARFPTLQLTWVAALGFLGLVRCATPTHFKRALLLVLPCAFYLALVFTVGDSRDRYLLPLEWILLLLPVLGIDWILQGLTNLFSRFTRPAQPSGTAGTVAAGVEG